MPCSATTAGRPAGWHREAVAADPELREAWEIMAELSNGSARQAYLERVTY